MAQAHQRPGTPTALDALCARLDRRVRPNRLRRATVANLVRAFEDLLEAFDLPALVLVGSDGVDWEADRQRCADLAVHENRRFVVISDDDRDPPPLIEVVEVPAEHPFARQRVYLALTPMVSATLIATPLPAAPGEEGDGQPFDIVWTFDPAVATAAWEVVRDSSLELAPELAQLADEALSNEPAPMTHEFGERYAVVILERLEGTWRRWHDLSVELLEARQQYDQRSERQVKLERLASIGTLAASVAHELNNPLASITVAASLMGQLDDLAERERVAGIIESEALRAGRIASDLLSYVADRELELSPTRLDEWLDELAVGYRASGSPVTLAAAPPVQVDIDRDRLRQVVTNLVDNALDAISKDGAVEIDLRLTGNELRIGVTDDGAGVPERLRDVLFDPFVTSKPRGKGTGLGLPIARAHLQDHGGNLELERTGPDGSRFVITLPRGGAPKLAAAAPAAVETARSAETSYTGRVLVVDDEPPIRSLLETLLGRHGWDVASASGLGEAVQAVQAGDVDIALIDVQLGVDDGPKVLRALEEVQPNIRDRAAFITGAAPASGMLDGRPVLGKPFSWADLAALLDQLRP